LTCKLDAFYKAKMLLFAATTGCGKFRDGIAKKLLATFKNSPLVQKNV
jgi:hypothetical protein